MAKRQTHEIEGTLIELKNWDFLQTLLFKEALWKQTSNVLNIFFYKMNKWEKLLSLKASLKISSSQIPTKRETLKLVFNKILKSEQFVLVSLLDREILDWIKNQRYEIHIKEADC